MTAAQKLEFTKLVMSNSEYHKHPAIGSSSLKDILKSPAHYRYWKDNPEEPTPAMQFGTAAHQALLEPELFTKNAVIMPKFEGTGSRAAKEQWLLENHGKTVLKAEEMADILGMMKAVSQHKTARSLLTGGASEESYFDVDPETGLQRKARPDFLRKGHMIVDIKTTIDASPAGFEKQIGNFSYHVSAAHYLDVVSNSTGQKFDQFIIVAIEKTPPYGITVHLLNEFAINEGRAKCQKAMQLFKECTASNIWPGYPDEILNTTIPNWARSGEF